MGQHRCVNSEGLKGSAPMHALTEAVDDGSLIDARLDAVESASVVLFGVSLKYKESASCRECDCDNQQLFLLFSRPWSV